MEVSSSEERFPKRLKCPDFLGKHKRTIYSQKNNNLFSKLGALAPLLQSLYPDKDNIDSECDVCKNCYRRFSSFFQVRTDEDLPSDNDHHDSGCVADEYDHDYAEEIDYFSDEESPDFELDQDDLCQEMNEIISKFDAIISPIRLPIQKSGVSKMQYGARKRKQIVEYYVEETSEKLSKICDTPLPKMECDPCEEWFRNFSVALSNCSNKSEQIRLLTILPDSFTQRKILEKFPDLTEYAIKESQKLKRSVGIYRSRDPFNRQRISDDDKKKALQYYLDDDYDCSRQSPNASDVRTYHENGMKVTRVRRFMTRSVEETYAIFRENNPLVNISRTTFYSLRPQHVVIQPPKGVCFCTYCANFDLLSDVLCEMRGLSRNNSQSFKDEMIQLSMCETPSEGCKLGECRECPGLSGLTLHSLGIRNEDGVENVEFPIWNKGELEKRSTSLGVFVQEFAEIVVKVGPHLYAKRIQQEAIKEYKLMTQENQKLLVIHGDFAESWSIPFQSAVQSNYWKSKQVSLFTAVCYYQGTKKSFGVVCDDTSHDSSHALLAMNKIEDYLKNHINFDSIEEIVKITDGAPAHFKNRYQAWELKHSSIQRSWIYSVTSHGKGACDGVGGKLKHYATVHNLRNSHLEAIDDATTFVEKVAKYTTATALIEIKATELAKFRSEKTKEWRKVPAVNGIRNSHAWRVRISDRDERIFQIARTAKHPWEEIDF